MAKRKRQKKPEAKKPTYMAAYYRSLIGATVVHVELKESEDGWSREPWPVITVMKQGQKFELEVSQDYEGNGPGFLFGLPVPEEGTYEPRGEYKK
jgi:hypothetical protein